MNKSQIKKKFECKKCKFTKQGKWQKNKKLEFVKLIKNKVARIIQAKPRGIIKKIEKNGIEGSFHENE